MASVPNRANPLNEYSEIFTNKFTSTTLTSSTIQAATLSATSFTTATIKATGKISGSSIVLSTINSTIPSASMSVGEIVVFTGASALYGLLGAAPILYIVIPSGSVGALYAISGSYVSQAK